MEVESHSVSKEALARSARTLVANAVAAAFNEDPVIGPDLSRAISVVGSVVKRHGVLLQSTAAHALAASGRFEVLVDAEVMRPTAILDFDPVGSEEGRSAAGFNPYFDLPPS